MLHLITSAPFMVVREIVAHIPGAYAERTEFGVAPSWADTFISVPRGDDAAALIVSLSRFRTEGWKPREHTIGTALVSNPTFAMAAAALEREGFGGSGAPAIAS